MLENIEDDLKYVFLPKKKNFLPKKNAKVQSMEKNRKRQRQNIISHQFLKHIVNESSMILEM
jgi:hypothetical protein